MLSFIFFVFTTVYAFDLIGTWANTDGESLVINSVNDGRFYGEYASIIDSHLGIYNVTGIVEKDCEQNPICIISFSTIWQNQHTELMSTSTWAGWIFSDGIILHYVMFDLNNGEMKQKDQSFTKQKLIKLFESFM